MMNIDSFNRPTIHTNPSPQAAIEKVSKPEMRAAMVEMFRLQLHLPFVQTNRSPACVAAAPQTIPASETEEIGGVVAEEEGEQQQHGRKFEEATNSINTN